MIQCQVKLILRPTQERLLTRWLWHLTGVYNWTIRTIELDAAGSRYPSLYDLKARIVGHSAKIGLPARAMGGTISTAHAAWKRCFQRRAKHPRLKGERNRLNSILFDRGDKGGQQTVVRDGKINIPLLGAVKFHKQDVPAGWVGQFRLIRRASGWYACLFIQAEPKSIVAGAGEVGIDPGFSSLLTLSTGEKIDRASELSAGALRLAQAQRGGRMALTARLQERIANRRKDRNHRLSRRIVEANGFIAFSADQHAKIARRFGKSVTSAGHAQLRQMLAYKSRSGGGEYVEVPSRNSTRTCSSCGALSGPTGWAGLSVRQWACGCGATHDRDCNAAVNTLLAGRGMRHERRRETASGIAL